MCSSNNNGQKKHKELNFCNSNADLLVLFLQSRMDRAVQAWVWIRWTVQIFTSIDWKKCSLTQISFITLILLLHCHSSFKNTVTVLFCETISSSLISQDNLLTIWFGLNSFNWRNFLQPSVLDVWIHVFNLLKKILFYRIVYSGFFWSSAGPIVAEAIFVNREEILLHPLYRDPVSSL